MKIYSTLITRLQNPGYGFGEICVYKFIASHLRRPMWRNYHEKFTQLKTKFLKRSNNGLPSKKYYDSQIAIFGYQSNSRRTFEYHPSLVGADASFTLLPRPLKLLPRSLFAELRLSDVFILWRFEISRSFPHSRPPRIISWSPHQPGVYHISCRQNCCILWPPSLLSAFSNWFML